MSQETSADTKKDQNNRKKNFETEMGKITSSGPQPDRSNWFVSAKERLGDIVWKAAGKFNPKERLQYVMDMLLGKREIAMRRSIMIEQSLPKAA